MAEQETTVGYGGIRSKVMTREFRLRLYLEPEIFDGIIGPNLPVGLQVPVRQHIALPTTLLTSRSSQVYNLRLGHMEGNELHGHYYLLFGYAYGLLIRSSGAQVGDLISLQWGRRYHRELTIRVSRPVIPLLPSLPDRGKNEIKVSCASEAGRGGDAWGRLKYFQTQEYSRGLRSTFADQERNLYLPLVQSSQDNKPRSVWDRIGAPVKDTSTSGEINGYMDQDNRLRRGVDHVAKTVSQNPFRPFLSNNRRKRHFNEISSQVETGTMKGEIANVHCEEACQRSKVPLKAHKAIHVPNVTRKGEAGVSKAQQGGKIIQSHKSHLKSKSTSGKSLAYTTLAAASTSEEASESAFHPEIPSAAPVSETAADTSSTDVNLE